MTSEDIDTAPPAGDSRRGLSGLLRGFSRWQRLLLLASVALMVLGVALRGYAAVSSWGDDENEGTAIATDAPAPGGTGDAATDPLRPSGFVASGDPVPSGSGSGDGESGDPLAEAVGMKGWSPVIFRLGFSFFVGFCIAYAVRTFVKISIIAIGALLLAIFGLQYVGLVDVNWGGMETIYDNSVAWMGEQTAGFGEFIRGALPSAAMAGLGLVVGFRRRV